MNMNSHLSDIFLIHLIIMKKDLYIIVFILLSNILFSCNTFQSQNTNRTHWKEDIAENIPLLGHRNWIVITDKAFPIQTKAGIEMIYAEGSYENVLSFVTDQLNCSTHIYGHFYQDKELTFLDESICPGIDDYRLIQDQYIPKNKVQYINHESLLNQIDSISSFYKVLVVKTNLVLPYTSTFIELDCEYWNSEKQQELNKKMQ